MAGQRQAQKRVQDSYRAHRQKEDVDLEVILEKTASVGSAVRAVNLERLLKKQWSQERNAYVLLSKLTANQQTKINSLLYTKKFF
jgi:hypothetical protein